MSATKHLFWAIATFVAILVNAFLAICFANDVAYPVWLCVMAIFGTACSGLGFLYHYSKL